jgi:hypothetical protein
MHSPDDVPVTLPAAHADPGGPDANETIAFRRSLRTSRDRRRAAALRRRRRMRGRRSILVAMAGLVVLAAGAVAQSTRGVDTAAPELSTRTIKAAQRALGVDDDGIIGPRTGKATRRFQRENRLEPDGILGPETLQALGVKLTAGSARAARPGAASTLEQIAQCESSGDPTAISADGRYRGKYQFDVGTWRSVGGAGDPAQAAEEEQDRRALRLLQRVGTTPWPNCA